MANRPENEHGAGKSFDPPSFEARVVAGMLASGTVILTYAHLTAATALVLFVGTADHAAWIDFCLVLVLLIWPLSNWYALRVAIDARLFAILNDSPATLHRFDQALVRWGIRPDYGPRDLDERIRGALRWWKRQLGLAAVQAIGLLGGLLGLLVERL